MPIAHHDDLTAEFVRSILDYDPATGIFHWRRRADVPREWNTRRAHKLAGAPCGGRGEWQIRISDRLYMGHRLAWLYVTGAWPPEEIDHANGNPVDNRFANLRLATRSQNMRNRVAKAGTRAGLKGVNFCKTTGRWRAKIMIDGKHIHLGRFDTAHEAAAAYRKAAAELQGGFAVHHRALPLKVSTLRG